MFENLQKKPEGLDDIFADTEPSSPANFSKNVAGQGINQVSTRTENNLSQNLNSNKNVESSFGDEEGKSSEVLKKMFIFIVIFILIGVGAYFVYSQILLPRSIENKQLVSEENNIVKDDSNNQQQEEENLVEEEVPLVNENNNQATTSDLNLNNEEGSADNLLKNLDSDSDGLSDFDETSLYKTDPYNPDSDSDGLNDYEEIMILGTDPLNPDSDGDTYLDGQELMNGYNPLGEGTINSLLFKNQELFKQKFPNLVK